ncbi:hypothetical protein TEA_002878 [Camellia sinensis var. sinensis]|uniref:Uncharacterized protein n=1 Tax=Camellia sinensis var. sinensis TaxID=542762 RepID=A0A4S4CXQ6_CAMSN|nr:hypothetical protein TEA_002878 [Camellia sinensis var. sinensis]
MDEVITAADVTSSSSPPSSPAALLPPNLPLLSAFLAFAIAQFLKEMETLGLIIRDLLCCAAFPMVFLPSMIRYTEKKWDSKRMIGSGGMPSSHSATVMALAVAIGLQEGTGGPTFAIAIVLACVVMYDASGVRLHAGRQAESLNAFPILVPIDAVVMAITWKEKLGEVCKNELDGCCNYALRSSDNLQKCSSVLMLSTLYLIYGPMCGVVLTRRGSVKTSECSPIPFLSNPAKNDRAYLHIRFSSFSLMAVTEITGSCRSHVGMPSSISNEELQLEDSDLDAEKKSGDPTGKGWRRIWKERVSAGTRVQMRADLPVMQEGTPMESESVGPKPRRPSNRMILPSISAPEQNILQLLEECNASGI